MTKEQFQELLQRYRAGNCSEEERHNVNSWFAKISDDNLELNDFEKAHVNQRMLSAIRQTLPSSNKQGKSRSLVFSIMKVAASLLITVLVVYAAVNRNSIIPVLQVAQVKPSADLIEHKNLTQQIVKIQLPDFSTVELKPNAEISYSKKFDAQKREVHLIGEAFFEVVKDSKRPFYVYGGEIVTKVLGTSFSVNATKDAESIEVAVRTGKVSVYEDSKKNNLTQNGLDASGVVLTPNEKVKYFVNDKHWVTSLVEQPKALPTANKALEFVFSDTPMSDIINSMERTYSIDIILESEASYSCTFTGDVSMMELYDILNVICKSTGTNYEVKGTKILITGKGCQ